MAKGGSLRKGINKLFMGNFCVYRIICYRRASQWTKAFYKSHVNHNQTYLNETKMKKKGLS